VQHSDKLSAASINSFFSGGKGKLIGALFQICGFCELIYGDYQLNVSLKVDKEF
jgi:hypothetical protein